MRRLSEKMLAILLILLVGLSPLQGAMAGFASLPDQGEGIHQMTDRQEGGMVMASDHGAAHDCEQCKAEVGCHCHNCLSGHCVSCGVVLPPAFSLRCNFYSPAENSC